VLLPVQGKVTLDGNPLTGGTVSFYPQEEGVKVPVPSAEIDAQGQYELRTGGRDGAPPGKYRATVTVQRGIDENAPLPSLNRDYSNPRKKLLEIEVRDGAPVDAYDLKLTSAATRS
jgi:hypothetical protein